MPRWIDVGRKGVSQYQTGTLARMQEGVERKRAEDAKHTYNKDDAKLAFLRKKNPYSL
jgi:hypothetical protein